MRKILFILTLIFLFSTPSVKAQTFGNEWINYSQKYFSFPIVQNGIYKISYQSLANAGIPVSSIPSGAYQIFGKEKEQPLYIQDNGNNVLDSNEFIFFYAERNDGWLDSTLYDDPAWMGNPKYSLYNDTLRYFFTWNANATGLRFTDESDIDFISYQPANYLLFEKSQVNSQAYNEGETSSQAASSFFVPGEGWGSTMQNGASGYTWNYSSTTLDNLYSGVDAPLVQFRSVVVGGSNAYHTGPGNHHNQHTLGVTNQVLLDTIFTGYTSVAVQKQFPVSWLPASGATNFKVNILGDLGVASDYQSINFWSFVYPRTMSLGGANKTEFRVNNALNQPKVHLSLLNANLTSPMMFVFGTTPKKIPVVQSGVSYKALIPNDPNYATQKIVVQAASTIASVVQLTPVNQSGYFTNFANVPNLEKALLFVYPKSLESGVIDYANYRSNPSGGDYNVILSSVDELFDQFGGGIRKHVNGIRRYAHFMHTISQQKPIGLFLIGKAIREANVSTTLATGPGTRNNTINYAMSLVPSFGQPSSDQNMTSNLPGTNKWTPLIPTGRISVNNLAELQVYLQKVQAFELAQDSLSMYNSEQKDWQKQILHFAGGGNANEQYIFQTYLNGMAAIAEDDYFAGETTTIVKQSGNPLTPVQVQAIADRIASGVTVMNFFGHATSSQSGFDINIDEPQYWGNQGKYPLLIANSCYNGNIFYSVPTKSEEFVLAPNAGVIAYLGTINYGFSGALNDYSNQFYRQFSTHNYGGTIGEHIRNTIDSVMNPSQPLSEESVFSQMTLHGDPMLRLNPHTKPEIELTIDHVAFGPNDIDLATDSIEISVLLRNLGQSITGDFALQILRNFPGSAADSNYVFTVNGLDYEKQIQVKIPLYPLIGIGLNQFTISADIPSYHAEVYDEINNNQVAKTFNIDIDGIEPILPIDFAVVPKDTLRVFASTLNPLAAMNGYRFEMDTTHTFNSPFLRYAIVNGTGGVKSVNWNQWTDVNTNQPAPVHFTDSTVYYWRVCVNTGLPQWKKRSFQYIPGKEGWGQDDFFQFVDNSFNGINMNTVQLQRQFVPIQKGISCLVKTATTAPQIYDNAWYINGEQQEYEVCNMTPKLHVAILDKATLIPWETRYTYPNGTVVNPNHNFGNANDNSGCKPRPMKYFTFHQDNATQLSAFQNMVQNAVSNGDYILVYSPMTTRYDWWNSINPGLYQTFANLGSDSIVPGRVNKPFIFLTRKGDPSFVVEKFTYGNEDLFIDTLLIGSQLAGFETTPMIGPVSDWQSLFWKRDPLEALPGDSTRLRVQVYNQFTSLDHVIDTFMTPHDSIIQLNNLIDASLFPFVKLNSYYQDSSNQTPAQLDFWHVVFAPLPEAAIDPSTALFWSAQNDSVQEGQPLLFSVDIRNISQYNMDSLLVNYSIIDENQVVHPIAYPRQAPLLANGHLLDTLTISTLNLKGLNWLRVEVNPYTDQTLSQTDQPELTHINNILQLGFIVGGEELNPILDVTFDGQHILNNDIVSPESEILISLKDENPYLVMNSDADTALFAVYVTDPDGIQKKVPFIDGQGNSIMQWIPANASNKKFKIIYPALFAKEGTYTLLVQGADRSGNLSGDYEYKINFQVSLVSSISQIMNYPNPFSTKTQFVFTLTGSEIPDQMQIQIMNISGKVVREITEDELGPLRIGRNITEFAWDGRDEYGDLLANGVYLYRVKVQANGSELKQLSTGADAYFHKGLGKMYIIR
ncbi:MAG: hypothetical protein EBR91_07495 [Flavobacteriia bacterium]|nr:hypothetical protein [Flavobacteriia bacterium]NBV91995.1 hypothetical protein [Flavobacteriia bacterium]